jgi:hypothetical protein
LSREIALELGDMLRSRGVAASSRSRRRLQARLRIVTKTVRID